MLFHFKREIPTRSYDISNPALSPLPLRSTTQNISWNKNLFHDLSAIFSSIFLSAIGYGILMVMIALKLELHVKNEILMSVSAATQIGAGVLISRFLPALGHKIGLIKSIYIGSIISAIFAIFAYFYVNYTLWLLTIFALGTSFFICGVTRNTIMIDLAPPQIRALIISIGTMLVPIGNSLGPVLLSFLKTSDGFISFVIASAFYLLSMLPLSRLRKIDANLREEKKISIWCYIKNSPKIMFASFAVNYSMSSASAFLIIYGIKIGIPKDQAALLLSVLLFGTIFSIPIGFLADIFNRRLMMIASAFLGLILAVILFFNHDFSEMESLLFLMFGSLVGIKLPAMVLINEQYKPTQRLAVNSAFAKFGLIGNICGLFLTGAIMKCCGPRGLWLSIALILLCFLSFCLHNYWKKISRKEFDIKNFSIFNKHQDEQLSDY